MAWCRLVAIYFNIAILISLNGPVTLPPEKEAFFYAENI